MELRHVLLHPMGPRCFFCLILECVKIGADLLPFLGGRDLMGQGLDYLYIIDGEEAFFHLPVAEGQKLVRWDYLHRGSLYLI